MISGKEEVSEAHNSYGRGYAVQIRIIINTSEDVQYESGTSLVE